MITREQKLVALNKQLARIETALEDLRQAHRGQDQGQLAVFSEGYVDMINRLKAQIDECMNETAPRGPAAVNGSPVNGPIEASSEPAKQPHK